MLALQEGCVPTRLVEERGNSLIESISRVRTNGLPFSAPKYPLRTVEAVLVRDVLQMLQGYPSNSFLWEESHQQFFFKKGIHLLHLSQSSLNQFLHHFVRAATSLRRIEAFVRRVAKTSCMDSFLPFQAPPTLQAFTTAVSLRLECLRKAAMKEELQAVGGRAGTAITLLSLSASLSWVCAGAEFLEKVVNEAVPPEKVLREKSFTSGELAAHLLSYLYDKLTEFCLVQDGEEEPYRTLLILFAGSVRPLTECLDGWLHEGNLSDPFGEMFFFLNKSIGIEDASFWQHGFHLRFSNSVNTVVGQHDVYLSEKGETPSPESQIKSPMQNLKKDVEKAGGLRKVSVGITNFPNSKSADTGTHQDNLVCPVFLRSVAKAVLSAGKSLQLLQYVHRESADGLDGSDVNNTIGDSSFFPSATFSHFSQMPRTKHLTDLELKQQGFGFDTLMTSSMLVKSASYGNLNEEQLQEYGKCNRDCQYRSMSLFEGFCQSLEMLLGKDSSRLIVDRGSDQTIQALNAEASPCSDSSQTKDFPKINHQESCLFNSEEECLKCTPLQEAKELYGNLDDVMEMSANKDCPSDLEPLDVGHRDSTVKSPQFLKDRPPLFSRRLEKQKLGDNIWRINLNLSRSFILPALNDEDLREAVFTDNTILLNTIQTVEAPAAGHENFGGLFANRNQNSTSGLDDQKLMSGTSLIFRGTDYGRGAGCGNLLVWHEKLDSRAMERLFPYPTTLPFFKECLPISELLPPQMHHKVAPKILDWLQNAKFKVTPLPAVLVQECLILPIQKQVEAVGKQVLNRLMGEWKLMEELAVLRAIYLIGSGDLLQQFSSVLFNKLDRGEPWDDFYELNTMLQESVRCSADGVLLPALDSLVVTVQPRANSAAEQGPGPMPLQFIGRNLTFGIDTLDSLCFVYKVAWPLELIIDKNAIKKYNQVMAFLLKVKRAKFALDKSCRWMWKSGAGDVTNLKQQLLLQQKLMHFVNTLHQYVMDRVLYSAWVELCEGMASACSLDEVIACHDAYLISIQRQCLVAPDKLWALISSRVKTVLGLALDFHSIQRTLCGGGAAPAIKARCQLEIDRVGRQFDECIVFLLRVLSFKLNVGHFPHLAELVTRINYNYFYISESGHLLTPLPEMSTGRVSQHGRVAVNSQN